MTQRTALGVHRIFVKTISSRQIAPVWKLAACALAGLLGSALLAQQPAGAAADRDSAPPAASGAAAPQNAEGPALAASPAAAARFSLDDLAWLQGEWNGAWGPRMAHQSWSEPHAGTMLGTLQIVEGDKTLVVEMVELTNTPLGVEYRLLHFTPTLAPWEPSGPAVLSLTSIDSEKIVFENLSDGEPREVVLMRSDPDTYSIRSQIAPASGDPLTNEIEFHRKKAQPQLKKK
jgi:hypothetical protein